MRHEEGVAPDIDLPADLGRGEIDPPGLVPEQPQARLGSARLSGPFGGGRWIEPDHLPTGDDEEQGTEQVVPAFGDGVLEAVGAGGLLWIVEHEIAVARHEGQGPPQAGQGLTDESVVVAQPVEVVDQRHEEHAVVQRRAATEGIAYASGVVDGDEIAVYPIRYCTIVTLAGDQDADRGTNVRLREKLPAVLDEIGEVPGPQRPVMTDAVGREQGRTIHGCHATRTDHLIAAGAGPVSVIHHVSELQDHKQRVPRMG